MGGFKHLCEVWLFVLSNLSKKIYLCETDSKCCLGKKNCYLQSACNQIRKAREGAVTPLLCKKKKKDSANKLIKTLSTFKALKANSNA